VKFKKKFAEIALKKEKKSDILTASAVFSFSFFKKESSEKKGVQLRVSLTCYSRQTK
jgi:hypothetical protein